MNRDASGHSPQEFAATIRDFRQAFEGFKTRNDERLDNVEGQVRHMNERFSLAANAGMGANSSARREFNAALRGQISAGMSTDSNPDGGYLVPEEIDRTIARLERQYSPMRRLARVVTARGHYSKPVINQGVSSGWTSERASRPETAGFKLAMIAPTTGEVYANVPVTQ
jgi:HK97 family phage major capsid protein